MTWAACRDWVSRNLPVVVRGGAAHWPALSLWSQPGYLRARLGARPVTVAVTPDGLADAPRGDLFMMPEERRMEMGQFLDILERPDSAEGVFYIQKQNSNLTDEFQDIMEDVDEDIAWATEAFGKKPDAVNFWMGDSRAVTSMHKDPYENIYCVVQGHKEVLLHPPTDLPWLPCADYRPATWLREAAGWAPQETGGPCVPWVAVDPLAPDLRRFPEYRHAAALRVRLGPGDILYLPSYWFHHLSQSQVPHTGQ
jgi:jumonji domain-containing protein 7